MLSTFFLNKTPVLIGTTCKKFDEKHFIHIVKIWANIPLHLWWCVTRRGFRLTCYKSRCISINSPAFSGEFFCSNFRLWVLIISNALTSSASKHFLLYFLFLIFMTHSLLHISDTIQSSNDSFCHDTTVDRLRLFYEVLQDVLDLEYSPQDRWVQLIGSTFWNSYETAAQAIAILKKQKFFTSQVLLVNNASRAKHENSTQAKGSDCLWAQVEIEGVTHHIVWVDDDAFTLFLPYLKRGTQIQKIKSLYYDIPEKDISLQIDDLSKDTQFRSKEHFLLVQLIFQKLLQQNEGHLPDNATLNSIFTFQDFEHRITTDFRKNILWLLEKPDRSQHISQIVESYVSQVGNNIEKIIREWGTTPTYAKSYLSGFDGIEKVQLLWELNLLREKFGIYTSHDYRDFGISANILKQYSQTRRTLKANQIVLIDRDKFGNCIFAYHSQLNGIHSFVDANWLTFVDKWNKDEQKPLKITGWGVEFSAFATKTISDLTGENCIWQSSSRWPSGEKLLNINTSINGEYQVLQEIQNLPIGTILTIDQGERWRDKA